MNALKQLYYRIKLQSLWKSLINELTDMSYLIDIRQLMIIIYNDNHKYPYQLRLTAGRVALAFLMGTKNMLFGSSWTDPETGRLAYLMGVYIYIPELQGIANNIVKNYYYTYEREAFENK